MLIAPAFETRSPVLGASVQSNLVEKLRLKFVFLSYALHSLNDSEAV